MKIYPKCFKLHLYRNKYILDIAWWHTPVVPTTQEGEIEDHSPRPAQAKV
jgi:hypothetical protein